MDIVLAMEALARELGLAQPALETELHRALLYAATAHYPQRELRLDFSEWGYELSQVFRVVERPEHPGDLSQSSLQQIGFECGLGETLVLPLISKTVDIDEVPQEVIIRGPIMPFEEMVTKRVLTRWLSREGAARLRETSPARMFVPRDSMDRLAPPFSATMDQPAAILMMGRILSFTPRVDARILSGLKELLTTQPDDASLTLLTAGSGDPVRRPLVVGVGRVLAFHHVPDLPVGPLDVANYREKLAPTDAALESIWPRVHALLREHQIDDGDIGSHMLDESTKLRLIVSGEDHDARLVSGRVVACPNRDDIESWDHLRYTDLSTQVRRGGMIEYPPLVAVDGETIDIARGGDQRRAPQLATVEPLPEDKRLFLLLTPSDAWEPPERERDEDGNALSVTPLELSDENPHLALEPSFRRPPTRCPARIRRVFLIDTNPQQTVIPLSRPQGPTGEHTLQAFDEFMQCCRPDLEADMRLRPPATGARITEVSQRCLGDVPLSADLERLYRWRDGQERRWPPLFVSSLFSFAGLEESERLRPHVERRWSEISPEVPVGWIVLGQSPVDDYLIVERGGHGRVLAMLHDGEPQERLWCISDSLLHFLFGEFRARVQHHEAPCMLAERLQFDESRLRRLSLQSLRRTNLEAAPRGTVIVLREPRGTWRAYARMIPDRIAWICAEGPSKEAALALLDDGIHRRPRTEWQLGNPDDFRHLDGRCLAWAGVMRIVY
jgi:hypothetical protein